MNMSSDISSISNMVQEVTEYLKANQSEHRFQHSLETSRNAKEIAHHISSSASCVEKTNLAGLSHDIAREWEEDKLIASAKEDYTLKEWELENPILLHGKAGAAFLRKEFFLEDEEVLEAVAWHTTGKPGMDTVAKILFIADYMRPETGKDKLYRGAALDELVLWVIEGKKRYARKKGYRILPPLLALESEYKDKRF